MQVLKKYCYSSITQLLDLYSCLHVHTIYLVPSRKASFWNAVQFLCNCIWNPLWTGNANLSGQLWVWGRENSLQGWGQVSRVRDEAQKFPSKPKTASQSQCHVTLCIVQQEPDFHLVQGGLHLTHSF